MESQPKGRKSDVSSVLLKHLLFGSHQAEKETRNERKPSNDN